MARPNMKELFERVAEEYERDPRDPFFGSLIVAYAIYDLRDVLLTLVQNPEEEEDTPEYDYHDGPPMEDPT